MKKLSMVLAMIMVFSLMFAGCKEDETGKTSAPEEKKAAVSDTKSNDTKADDGKMEEEVVDIEIMMQPWVSDPLASDVDPYKTWFDEQLGANVTLTTSSEFDREVLTRFAAGSPPDIIICNYETLLTLYDQGVLVDDWTPYLDKMPTVSEGMGDASKMYYTREGKLITLTNPPGGQSWTWNIRQDWLETLGLPMPTTPEELLDVARGFTHDDPDGNGKDDTYAFTSTGAGESLGEISSLKLMFGPSDFYIAEDGSVQNYITDGNEKRFLEFLKTAVDEGLVEPDWYSQGWDDRKPNLYKGMYGTVYYPSSALINETEIARDSDHAVLDWYTPLIPLPAGTDIGGLQLPTGIKGGIKTVSAQAAQDSAKFEKILELFEISSFPNDGYYQIRWGKADAIEHTDLGDGYVYVNNAGTEATLRSKEGNGWLFNWGKMIAVQGKDMVIKGSTPTPGIAEERVVEVGALYNDAEKYRTDYQLLALDLDALTETKRLLDEFEINYILGNDTDYDAFVERWLEAGGQQLLDEATEQFESYGLIK